MVFAYQQITSGDYHPLVDFKLSYRLTVQPVKALVDSGADVSVFKIALAEALGIKLTHKNRVSLSGIGGGIYGYYYQVTFKLAGQLFKAPVIFADNSAPYNLLGRSGIFNRFTVCFDETARELRFTPNQ